MNQNFQIGDRVAHKHYPEQAIGEVVKFYTSGRVGVRDNEGWRDAGCDRLLVFRQVRQGLSQHSRPRQRVIARCVRELFKELCAIVQN